MITISVPLTTANLGPGFDCLGLAIDVFNVYKISSSRKMLLQGFPKEFSDENNLFYKVYLDMFRKNNKVLHPVEITFKQALPSCGGLGSSATAVIAAIIAYKFFVGEKITKQELINEALQYEKHPDNIVPAVLGGFTSSVLKDGKVISSKLYIDPNWRVYLFLPNLSIATDEARSVLPQDIKLEDAIFNMSRAILIPEALARGDEDLLFDLIDDRLHEPYRIKLIPGAKIIKDFCKKHGFACFLSGAGASMALITKRIFSPEFPAWDKRMYKVNSDGALYER